MLSPLVKIEHGKALWALQLFSEDWTACPTYRTIQLQILERHLDLQWRSRDRLWWRNKSIIDKWVGYKFCVVLINRSFGYRIYSWPQTYILPFFLVFYSKIRFLSPWSYGRGGLHMRWMIKFEVGLWCITLTSCKYFIPYYWQIFDCFQTVSSETGNICSTCEQSDAADFAYAKALQVFEEIENGEDYLVSFLSLV